MMIYQIWDYFKKLFRSYGLLNKSGNLLFLGLDNAGKTTLLFLLKENRIILSHPTQFATSEEFILDNLRLTTYDIGGHEQVRRVWRDYFPITNGIIFLLDVTDRKRFEEAKVELHALLNYEELLNCPFAILANKIDKYGAAGEQEIIDYFNLSSILTGKSNFKLDQRPVELFMCSLHMREGYSDALKWISNFI